MCCDIDPWSRLEVLYTIENDLHAEVLSRVHRLQ